MSHLSDNELAQLRLIAAELREGFTAHSHQVDAAMTHAPFARGRTRSSLTRDLVVREAARATRLTEDFDFRPTLGDGRELRFVTGSVDRRFRIRKAKRSSEREMLIYSSSESALAFEPADLFSVQLVVENWVFGWIPHPNGMLDELFVAEVLGLDPGRPGRLILGSTIDLGEPGFPTRGFKPTDDDLGGFDAEEDDGDDFGFGSAS